MKHKFIMSNNEGYLSTFDLPSKEKFSFWSDWVFSEFGGLDCTPEDHLQFEGVIHSKAIQDFNLTEVYASKLHVARSTNQLRKSSIDDIRIVIPLTSSARVSQLNSNDIVHPGDIVLFDSTSPYHLDFEKDHHSLVLQIPRASLGQEAIPYSAFGRVITTQQGIGYLLTQQVQGLFREVNNLDERNRLFILENIVELLKRAVEANSEDVDRSQLALNSALLASAKKKIEIHLDDEQLSPQFLAVLLGVSIRYVHKLFEPTGLTFSKYVMLRRLERAARILSDSKQHHFTIIQIALICGFANAAHFSRSFKQRFGISPKDYRKKQFEVLKSSSQF